MNLHPILLAFGLFAVAAAWNVGAVAAGEICCAICGGHNSCNKVCRLVCEEKKVDVICWGVKCEDFCIPGPSKPGCKHCEVVCDQCDPKAKTKPDDPHSQARQFVWRDWMPWKPPQIHTKRKLMQKIETKKIPSYKWVVEDLCKECESKAKSAAVPPGAEVPPLPAVDARVLPVGFAENTAP